MEKPDRLIGLHFFNPAHRMPLVEVIRRESTPDEVIATGLRFAKTLRKTPVLVRNREGFLVNRLFLPYLKEAFALLEEGATAPEIDAAMTGFGFPMGPLTLIDMAGIDIMLATDTVLQQAFPFHGSLSKIVDRLVESDQLGQKTGSGVYRYEKGSHTPLESESAAEIIAAVQNERGLAPREIGEEEITERLVMRMVAEAFRVLDEELVLRESDIDAAMVLGTGFPDYRGGACKYARDLGEEEVRERLRSLSEKFGERFAVVAKRG
jgi:3-hydroxyacyl-CoA dehydrogenase